MSGGPYPSMGPRQRTVHCSDSRPLRGTWRDSREGLPTAAMPAPRLGHDVLTWPFTQSLRARLVRREVRIQGPAKGFVRCKGASSRSGRAEADLIHNVSLLWEIAKV